MEAPIQEDSERVLAHLSKSDREEVRIREKMFKGKQYVDIRIFSKNRQGEFIPTRKGVMLQSELFKKLRATLGKTAN